jgi:prepilin-type N-terminal cleavage/methylation domain-containing protein
MRSISATGRARGFTLLELLVVVAVVALLTGALGVALNRALPGRRTQLTAERLVGVVRDASAASVASGKPVRIELDTLAVPASTQISLTDMNGQALRELVVFPAGSTAGGTFDVVSGVHRASVRVSAITGRVFVVATR